MLTSLGTRHYDSAPEVQDSDTRKVHLQENRILFEKQTSNSGHLIFSRYIEFVQKLIFYLKQAPEQKNKSNNRVLV